MIHYITGYKIIDINGLKFIPLRYDNFAALDCGKKENLPYPLVPYFSNINLAISFIEQSETNYTAFLGSEVYELSFGLGSRYSTFHEQNKLYQHFPCNFYRGHSTVKYSLMPSLYRFDNHQTIETRLKDKLIKSRESCVFISQHTAKSTPTLSELEIKALARHHGVDNELVDFTTDLKVAGFFASPSQEFADRDGEIGLIYWIPLSRLHCFFQVFGIKEDRDGVNVMLCITQEQYIYTMYSYNGDDLVNKTDFRLDIPNQLVGKLFYLRLLNRDICSRVKNQKGIFLSFENINPHDWYSEVFLWTVIDLVAYKVAFQRDGKQFVHPECSYNSMYFVDDHILLSGLDKYK